MVSAGLALCIRAESLFMTWLCILLSAGICEKIISQLKGRCRSSLCFVSSYDSSFPNWVPLTLLTGPRLLPSWIWQKLISWWNQPIFTAPLLLSPFLICFLYFSLGLDFLFLLILLHISSSENHVKCILEEGSWGVAFNVMKGPLKPY